MEKRICRCPEYKPLSAVEYTLRYYIERNYGNETALPAWFNTSVVKFG